MAGWQDWLSSAAVTATGTGLDLLEGLGKSAVGVLTAEADEAEERVGSCGQGASGLENAAMAGQRPESAEPLRRSAKKRLRLGLDLAYGVDLVARGVEKVSKVSARPAAALASGRSSLSAALRDAARAHHSPPASPASRNAAARAAWDMAFAAAGGDTVWGALAASAVAMSEAVCSALAQAPPNAAAHYAAADAALRAAIYLDPADAASTSPLALSLGEWVAMVAPDGASLVWSAASVRSAEAALAALPSAPSTQDAVAARLTVAALELIAATTSALASHTPPAASAEALAAWAAEGGTLIARIDEWLTARLAHVTASPHPPAVIADGALVLDAALRHGLISAALAAPHAINTDGEQATNEDN
ncbi:uncharacterized protein AMSG_08715 [Thecamonas trahens ATCC 50062]|uniref:Uncharacterized protein n=1 Tax=Thecamonas trahens ATCC 50062 TaxID=461836 RepID=A0A0L0DP81_THETB|nr:hypothetical protein AMSG_08715 [Thecamonas trahens ATCC 50062]KNC53233.1 hypothetical protein AMSG_08715 [Thecamonas trahens ATCC 50062]|eukprot:XP_013754500.1 hypothetical protein AMSG_08715 [Thecamonas trahens ATCC 50062]